MEAIPADIGFEAGYILDRDKHAYLHSHFTIASSPYMPDFCGRLKQPDESSRKEGERVEDIVLLLTFSVGERCTCNYSQSHSTDIVFKLLELWFLSDDAAVMNSGFYSSRVTARGSFKRLSGLLFSHSFWHLQASDKRKTKPRKWKTALLYMQHICILKVQFW